jgi:hypothetical protein
MACWLQRRQRQHHAGVVNFRRGLVGAPDQRKKPISVLCTDTRVEIPAIVEMVEGTLDKMRKCSNEHGLNVDANLLRPPSEQSF